MVIHGKLNIIFIPTIFNFELNKQRSYFTALQKNVRTAQSCHGKWFQISYILLYLLLMQSIKYFAISYSSSSHFNQLSFSYRQLSAYEFFLLYIADSVSEQYLILKHLPKLLGHLLHIQLISFPSHFFSRNSGHALQLSPPTAIYRPP